MTFMIQIYSIVKAEVSDGSDKLHTSIQSEILSPEGDLGANDSEGRGKPPLDLLIAKAVGIGCRKSSRCANPLLRLEVQEHRMLRAGQALLRSAIPQGIPYQDPLINFFFLLASDFSRVLSSLAAFMSLGAVVRMCLTWVSINVDVGAFFKSHGADRSGTRSSNDCKF